MHLKIFTRLYSRGQECIDSEIEIAVDGLSARSRCVAEYDIDFSGY